MTQPAPGAAPSGYARIDVASQPTGFGASVSAPPLAGNVPAGHV